MADEVTNLKLGVDTSSVKTGAKDLDAFAAAGTKAETAATGLERAGKSASEGLAAAGRGAATANAAQAALGRNSKTAADGLGAQATAAKLTANQTAQLSAQLQDLFVQIQAGGSPLTALIQQGSQLSAVFGGIGPALRAVSSLFTLTRVAALGLGGAVGGLALAFAAGDEQSRALQRTLILTGNAAGLTEGKFNTLAAAISESTKTSIGGTRETLQGLLATGRFTSDTLTLAAEATQLLAKATGQSTDDIVKSFADATDAPTRFAQTLNRTYNFLSASQIEQVRQLEDQGKAGEALNLVFASLIPRLQQASTETTALSKAWALAKTEVSAFADALLSIGRDRTAEDKLREITANIAELQRAGQKSYVFGPSLAELEKQRAALQGQVDAQNAAARAAAERVKQEQAGVAFNALLNSSKSRQQQYEEAITAAREKGKAAGASAADVNAVTAALQRQFGILAQARELQDIAQGAAAGAVSRQLQSVGVAFQNANAELEAQRAAFLLSDRAYYDAKAALIRGSAEAEINAQQALIEQERSRKVIAENTVDAERQRVEIAENIANAEARIAVTRADAASKLTVLSTQEDEALRRQRKALSETQIAAELYVEALKRAGDVQVAGVGLGDRARQQQADLAAIQERYQRERENLDAQYSAGALRGKRDEYEQRLRILDASQQAEEAVYARTFQRITEAQKDWTNGARRAFSNYSDYADDAASRTEEALTGALQRAEDALASFLAGGRFSLSAFADFARQELARAFARDIISSFTGSANPFSSLIGAGLNLFTGLSVDSSGYGINPTNIDLPTRGGRAGGGTVERGGMYRINELDGPGEVLNVSGRQYLLAKANGTVSPGGSGGNTVQQTNNFYFSTPPDRRSQSQVAAAAGQGIQRALARNT